MMDMFRETHRHRHTSTHRRHVNINMHEAGHENKTHIHTGTHRGSVRHQYCQDTDKHNTPKELLKKHLTSCPIVAIKYIITILLLNVCVHVYVTEKREREKKY